MAIIGESFEEYVNDQIKVRQKIYGSKNRTPEQLTYLNGRTAWVRLISSVDIKNNPSGSNDEGTKKLQACGLDDSYLGSRLAKEYILFAGTSNANNSTTVEDFGGSKDPINLVGDPSSRDLRRGVSGGAYGMGGTEFGLQPMPTLGDVEIKYKNRGSLRESNLTIKCFNPQQFQIIDTLYLHLGYTVLLEWGNSSYFDNEGGYISDNRVSMQELMFDLSVQQTHLEVLKSILDKREKSKGNYDAFYGKIANYSWTFDNGVYNISLKLISLGDIIESLNMNFLSVKPSKIEDKDKQEESTIKSERDKNDLAKLFFTASTRLLYSEIGGGDGVSRKNLNEIDQKAFEGSGEFVPQPSLSLNDVAIEAGFEGIEFSTVKDAFFKFEGSLNDDADKQLVFIKFGALLEFIEKTQEIYTSNNLPLTKIDYESGKSFMVSSFLSFPSNPLMLIFNFELKSTITLYSFFQNLPEFKRKVKDGYIGDIMNLYLNTNFIFEKIIENEDKKGDVSLFKFLDAICSAVNSTLGNGSSIAPFIDESTNTLSIIEEGTLPGIEDLLKRTTNQKLQLYGYSDINTVDPKAGFVKSFNLKTEITNDLATMISIGAQASGEIVKGIDATAFASWNRGLVDRIIPVKKEIDLSKKPPYSIISRVNSPISALNEEYKGVNEEFFKILKSYKENTISRGDLTFNTKISLQMNDYKLKQIILEKETKNSGKTIGVTQPGFLPINLNLTLDGISGPTILQQFEVEGRFLPHPIPDTLTFLIKGLNHKISNNVWTTTIDSVSVPKFVKSSTTSNNTPSAGSPKTSSNYRKLSECEVLMVDGFETPPTYEGKAIAPPKRNSILGINLDTRREIFSILESDEFKRKYTKGHRMIALAYTIKEGYTREPRSLSYMTLNPGNIGNTDSGKRNPQPSLRKGIELLMNYFETRANGTEPGWEFGPKTIPQYYSTNIEKNPKTYQRPNGCLPGYTGDYQGQIGYFVKRYATFARVNNNGISALMTIFFMNDYPSKIDGNTLLSDLLAFNPSTPIKIK
jgi:hypothetical protein